MNAMREVLFVQIAPAQYAVLVKSKAPQVTDHLYTKDSNVKETARARKDKSRE